MKLKKIHSFEVVIGNFIVRGDCFIKLLRNSLSGVYMGVFNMFIVIPQIVSMLILPLIYKNLLGNSPSNALFYAGLMLLTGGFISWKLKMHQD